MAAFTRQAQANYEVHETVKIDTHDNEDHTFCGIMFPIKAKEILPVDRVVVRSVAIRGQLGPLTVWVSNELDEDTRDYNFHLNESAWTKIYENEHPPSHRDYLALVLSEPVVIKAGQVRAIYIHSTLQGDEAIVYDNSRNLGVRRGPSLPRFEDTYVSVLSGKAHLSNIPFGQTPIWGWGNAWRDHREFVGRIEYGVVYKLWQPEIHLEFGDNFRAATQTMLACQRRKGSPLSLLPDECIFFVLNMCRWDAFGDTHEGMQARRKHRKRLKRLLELERQEKERLEEERKRKRGNNMDYDAEDENDGQEEEDDRSMAGNNDAQQGAAAVAVGGEAAAAAPAEAAAAAAANNDDDGGNDSDESEWERANGYRADTTMFSYRDVSSDDDLEGFEAARTAHERQSWIRRNLARIHVLRALGGGSGAQNH